MQSKHKPSSPPAPLFALVGLLFLIAGSFLACIFLAQSDYPQVRSESTRRGEVGDDDATSKAQPATIPPNGRSVSVIPAAAFSRETQRLVRWIDAGNPIEIRIGDGRPRSYGLHPATVTTDAFVIATGPAKTLPAVFRVFSGRELLPGGGLGPPVALAVVNDAASFAVTTEEGNFIVETDSDSHELIATKLRDFGGNGEDGNQGTHSASCRVGMDGLATTVVSRNESAKDPEQLRADLIFPDDGTSSTAPEEPLAPAAWVDHPYFRRGTEYDASLKDVIVLWASSQSQTGSSADLSSRAASYLTYAARVADTYERQLGFRYLLQELILIASDSGEADPGNPPSGTTDLAHWKNWLDTYRPQGIYGWGHAALWTVVEGSPGGVIGRSWQDFFGNSTFGQSVQERDWAWDVHNHEFGHSVGAAHTNGGVMNATLLNNEESFFHVVESGTITAAMDIYNYMANNATALANQYGPAILRHPEEIPFGVDDLVITPIDTPLLFDPLANDLTAVLNGAENVLTLVEVGQVYPKAAGSAQVVGNEIEFTPAAGFVGQAWFTYTLAGDVGNDGKGWLHSADVIVTVGGDSTLPTLTPALSATDDLIKADFSHEIRFNPLLNDEGEGRLWSGDVEVLLAPDDTTPESYSDHALHLVSATIITGNGTVAIEQRKMTRGSVASQDNDGYLVYTPGAVEPEEVVIEYVVEDANGVEHTGTIRLKQTATVTVSTDRSIMPETLGRTTTVTFTRGTTADVGSAEIVEFSIKGAASLVGSQADLATGGFDAFDPVTGRGSVAIPAGETSATIVFSALHDGLSEPDEPVTVRIVRLSSLLIGIPYKTTFLVTDDDTALQEDLEDQVADLWEDAEGDDFSWSIAQGPTLTRGTGPDVDHTTGTAAGHFLYTESSNPNNPSKRADIVSPFIDLVGADSADFEFWYNMFGATMGDLHVDVFSGGVWVDDVTPVLSGQQSADGSLGEWKMRTISLAAYLGESIRIRFRGITGSDTSDMAIDDLRVTMTRTVSPAAPVIVQQPMSQSVQLPAPFYLSVIAQAFPAPSYQWRRNGIDIPGATGPTFYVSNASMGDLGNYTCVVANSAGTATSAPATISTPGAEPATIVSEPLNQNVNEGDTVVFSVTATGAPAPTFQWRRNGVDLYDGAGVSGANLNALTLTSVAAGDAGSYTCFVSNTFGSDESSDATLVVNHLPAVAAGGDRIVAVNIPLPLNGSASDTDNGPGELSILWSVVSGPGAAMFTDTGALDGSVAFDTPGTYVLRLTASDTGATTFDEMTVTVVATQTFAAWISTNYPDIMGANALADANPDSDSLVNLLEFAFNLPPDEADASAYLPVVFVATDVGDGNQYLHISYRRRTGGAGETGVNYTADGIVYTVQVCTSLMSGGWESGAQHVEAVGEPADNGDGTETVTVRWKEPVSVVGWGFLRLCVTEI